RRDIREHPWATDAESKRAGSREQTSSGPGLEGAGQMARDNRSGGSSREPRRTGSKATKRSRAGPGAFRKDDQYGFGLGEKLTASLKAHATVVAIERKPVHRDR